MFNPALKKVPCPNVSEDCAKVCELALGMSSLEVPVPFDGEWIHTTAHLFFLVTSSH